MKALAALFDIVPGWVWALICAGFLGWGTVNTFRLQGYRADLAQLKADQAIAASEAQRRASAQTRTLQENKDAAIAQAEQRAETNRVAAAGARTELDRLRQQSASGASNAGSSIAACTHYAATANAVLDECAGALVSLAEAADGHVNDLRTARDAWPEWDKFAGQMTDFTNRLKGLP